MSILHNERECALLRYRMTPEHCRRTADRKDCVNGDISGMVVTRRVPSPRSVRHLLQVASVSASVVGKRVLHVKHGRSASSRACQTRRELAVLGARLWSLQQATYGTPVHAFRRGYLLKQRWDSVGGGAPSAREPSRLALSLLKVSLHKPRNRRIILLYETAEGLFSQ